MTRALHTVIETEAFISKASKIMSDDERAAIVDMIAADPMAGVLVKGTGGLRKLACRSKAAASAAADG